MSGEAEFDRRFREFREAAPRAARRFRDREEHLDDPALPLPVRIELLRGLSEVNQRFGFNARFLRELGPLIRAARERKGGGAVSILDLGMGDGGLLKAVHRWAAKRGEAVALAGLEISPEFVREVRKSCETEGVPIRVIEGDARDLGLVAKEGFDILISSHMIHHIQSAADVARLLRGAREAARHGWLLSDLDRRASGPWLLRAARLLLRQPAMLWEDGFRSLRRCYTAREINWILGELGTGMRCEPRFFFPYWMISGMRTA